MDPFGFGFLNTLIFWTLPSAYCLLLSLFSHKLLAFSFLTEGKHQKPPIIYILISFIHKGKILVKAIFKGKNPNEWLPQGKFLEF